MIKLPAFNLGIINVLNRQLLRIEIITEIIMSSWSYYQENTEICTANYH